MFGKIAMGLMSFGMLMSFVLVYQVNNMFIPSMFVILRFMVGDSETEHLRKHFENSVVARK